MPRGRGPVRKEPSIRPLAPSSTCTTLACSSETKTRSGPGGELHAQISDSATGITVTGTRTSAGRLTGVTSRPTFDEETSNLPARQSRGWQIAVAAFVALGSLATAAYAFVETFWG